MAQPDSNRRALRVTDSTMGMSALPGPGRTHVFLGLAACALGVWVICGWFLRIPLWVRLLPGFAPMQFNTAAGIVVAGVGVALLQCRPRLAAACGWLVAVGAAGVLLEFSLGVDLGIDELLFETWLLADSVTPGRMGISTAVCFLIVGVSLGVSATRSRSWLSRRTMGGMCLLGISIVSLLAYLVGIESAFRWGDATRMAAHTAVAFALLGAALVGPWKPLTRHGQRLGKSLAVGTGLAAVAVFVWSGVMAEHRKLIRERLDLAALNRARMLAHDVNAVASTLKRLSERWPAGCGRNTAECEKDLVSYFRDLKLNRVGWIGPRGSTSYHRPTEATGLGNPETAWDFEELQAMLDQVAPAEALSGVLTSRYPASLVILNRKSEASPVFFATFDPAEFLHRSSGGLEQGWNQRVWIDSLDIEGSGPHATEPGRLAAEREITVLGITWTFAMDADLAALPRSSFNDLTLLFGLIMAFSVGSATFLLQTSLDRSRQLRVNNQKLAEETRRAAEANRSKSEFLAVMSHEIRTPMNAILGMAELLQESKLTEEQRRYIDICHRAGSSLLVLINDILDLSKIEADRLELAEIDFRLSDLINGAADLVRSKAQAKGLALEVDVVAGTPEQLVGDPSRLRQVLVNLLGNAVKFTESGRVALAVGASKSGPPGEIHFAVSDTGCGIPAGKIEMIFHRFTQADSSATRQHGGTGLGLAISRRLVERMGGRLSVSSTEGEGSTFEFSVPFPVAPAADQQSRTGKGDAEVSPAPLAAARPLRILVADDALDTHLLIRKFLNGSPYVPTFVVDGQSAVDQFLDGEFDLILMDIQMPVLDGLAATRAIRQVEKEAGAPPLPILAFSVNSLPEDVQRSAQAGCTAHLTKPISQSRLLAAIALHAPTARNLARP